MTTLTTSFGTGEVFWSMLWFCLFFIWIWLLIGVFADIFRSQDLSGWGKALWTVFVIVLPYLGVLVYLIARGSKMNEHAAQAAQAQDAATRSYIQGVAGNGSGNRGGNTVNNGGNRGNGNGSGNRGNNNNINTGDRNTNVNVNGGGYNNGYHGGGCCYGGIGYVGAAALTTAAVITTAAVVGSIVYSQPSGCVNSMYGGYNYMNCSGTWYQPMANGSSTQYVVVNAPY